MKSYRDLIYDSGLYPEEVIHKFGEQSVHWSRESWIKREKSLRHDMCCLLLANLTPEDKEENLATVEDPSGKVFKYRLIQREDGTTNLVEVHPRVLPTNNRRYQILEGTTVSGLIQNVLYRDWGMSEGPIGTWDLIDQRARKFIEVKITTDYDKALNDFNRRVVNNREFYALVWFNPTNLANSFINCEKDDFTGVDKVISFLGHRNLLLNEAGMLVSQSNEEDDLESVIFVSPHLNALVDLWKSKWLDLEAPRMKEEELSQAEIPMAKLVEISQLHSCMEDPSKREAEFVKYNGRILPESMLFHMYTSEDKDIRMVAEMVNTWMEEIIPNYPGTAAEGILAEVSQLLEKNLFNPGNYPFLRKYLGVGAKERSFRVDDETTRIPDKEPPKPLRYHPWMHNMIRDMTLGEPDIEGVAFPELLEDEVKTGHPMEKISKKVVSEVTNLFCRGLVGHWCQKIKNIYSRIGGVYSNKGDNMPGHNNIAVFPIYSKVKTEISEDGDKYDRRMSGIIIRAPDHTRQGSDKINIVSIEMTKSNKGMRKYYPFIKNVDILKGSEYDLVIRQNALMKLDSSYLTFSVNSLFNVTNFIGEMILFEESHKEFADPIKEGKEFCKKYSIWIKERLVECSFMMLMGGSQEEGLLAMHRMLYMILLNMERQRECFIYNVEGFCKKTNECVINKPLAMYFQKNMVDAIELLNQV